MRTKTKELFTTLKIGVQERNDFRTWCGYHGFSSLMATRLALIEFMNKHDSKACPVLNILKKEATDGQDGS